MLSLTRKIALCAALLAFAEARFGQEQEPVALVQALQFGEPGEAATLAGQIPSSLLAAASPCDKLALADQIAALGDDPSVLEAAIGLVSAETNFNPFAVDRPFVCSDASLPATEALRGIVPLVDPDVTDAATANQLSDTSIGAPFDATGLSQAEVFIAQGFTTFQAADADGNNVNLAGQDAAGGAAGGAAGDAADDAAGDDAAGDDAAADDATAEDGAAAGGNGNANNNNNNNNSCGGGNANNNNGNGNANNGNGNANDNQNGNDNANDNADNANDNANDNQNGNDNADNGNDNADNGNDNGNDNADNGNDNADNGNDNAGGNAGAGGADFGDCTPTIDLQGGRNGRDADELTFLPTDPLVAEGQQEALNPNIITNRVCDQLGNVCGANEAAIALCEDAKAQVEAAGTRDQSTADLFNSALGF